MDEAILNGDDHEDDVEWEIHLLWKCWLDLDFRVQGVNLWKAKTCLKMF